MSKKKLTPAQKTFVGNYADPSSETFSNATKSMLKAKKNSITAASAAVTGCRLLQQDHIQNEIEICLAKHGADEPTRLEILAKITKGEYTKTVTSTFKNAEGEVQRTIEIESNASPADIVRADNLIWKATGRYDANRAKADILSARTKQLMDRFAPKEKGKKVAS